jgi:hypothetical protein
MPPHAAQTTPRTATDLTAEVAAFDAQITSLKAQISDSEVKSAELALAASSGDRAAATEMAKLRAQRIALQDELQVFERGRVAAEIRRQEVAKEQAAAEAEAGRSADRALVLARVAAAARFDATAAALEGAYDAYAAISRELLDHPYCPISPMSGGGISTWERLTGPQRIVAAMPSTLMAALYPQLSNQWEGLEASEAHMWGLQPQGGQ